MTSAKATAALTEDTSVRRVPLTIAEAAKYMNLTERAVRRYVEQERIPFHKVGKFIRFCPSELDAWFGAARRGPQLP